MFGGAQRETSRLLLSQPSPVLSEGDRCHSLAEVLSESDRATEWDTPGYHQFQMLEMGTTAPTKKTHSLESTGQR